MRSFLAANERVELQNGVVPDFPIDLRRIIASQKKCCQGILPTFFHGKLHHLKIGIVRRNFFVSLVKWQIYTFADQ